MTRWLSVALVCLLAPVMLIAAVTGGLSGPRAGSWAGAPDPVADVPAGMAALYGEAAAHFGVDAALLMAIGKVECDHARDPRCSAPNEAGAQGPMQFLPGTFAAYAWASGAVAPSPYDARDAVFAAAAKLASDGVRTDPWQAVYSYNHDHGYVATVVAWSVAYGWLPGDAVAERAVSVHPRIGLQSRARHDIELHAVDQRVLAVLLVLATSHDLDHVGPFVSGHDLYVDGTTRPSNHAAGRAVDVPYVDGVLVSAASQAAHLAAARAAALVAPLRPDELGSPWHFAELGAQSFTEGHGDHLHIGFERLQPGDSGDR